MNGYVKQEQYYERPKAPYAFGEAWGSFVDIKNHARNIAVLDDGKVYIVEPQTDGVRLATADDAPVFIRM